MSAENIPARRAARIPITAALLHVLLKLPKDLHAEHVSYDPHTDTLYLIVSSEHLPPIYVGDELPIITPQYRGTYSLRGVETIAELTAIDGYDGPLDRESFLLVPDDENDHGLAELRAVMNKLAVTHAREIDKYLAVDDENDTQPPLGE